MRQVAHGRHYPSREETQAKDEYAGDNQRLGVRQAVEPAAERVQVERPDLRPREPPEASDGEHDEEQDRL